MSFRGIPADNDARYTNAEKKLLQNTKFPAIFQTKVDTTKVNLQVLRNWIDKRITELLGIEDEVVVELVHSLMEERYPDPKKCQITLTGFLEKSAPKFMQEFWEMLISAQESVGGIPAALVEAKKAELRERRIEESQITRNLDKRMNRSRSPSRRFDQGQQQSRDDFERPLRMREPQLFIPRRDRGPPQGRPERRFEERDGSDGRDRRRNNEYARPDINDRESYRRSNDRRPSIDALINRDRSRTRNNDGRLSPVVHQERSDQGQRSTSDIHTTQKSSLGSPAQSKRGHPDSQRRPRSISSTRRGSVDSIGRRKRTRDVSSRETTPQRSRNRRSPERVRRRSRSSRRRSPSRDRHTSRSRYPRHSRTSRHSKSKSYRRSRSRSSARSNSRSRSSSRSRSRSRERRHRRSRKDEYSRRHRSSKRSERGRRRPSRSPSSSSTSRSPSRSRTRQRQGRHHSSDRSRSSSPARRRDRSRSAQLERGRSRESPDKNISSVPVDEEALHRENVLKAKLLRQKRMAEAKAIASGEASSAAPVEGGDAQDDTPLPSTEGATTQE